MGSIWKPSRMRIHKLSEGAYILLTDWFFRFTRVALDDFGLAFVGVSEDQSPVPAQPLKKATINAA
ncbi:hypothetical protein PKF032_09720 [Polynucleobacter yangtzensis]|uniref:Transposase n=1 Tax=Polynucleobacter yangtzensis TaxID=1743159 RepID=A0ABM8CMN4_9BURK|nr:hypothetical protein PKF032_09720 [Polynucleobacter yangtzensis]